MKKNMHWWIALAFVVGLLIVVESYNWFAAQGSAPTFAQLAQNSPAELINGDWRDSPTEPVPAQPAPPEIDNAETAPFIAQADGGELADPRQDPGLDSPDGDSESTATPTPTDNSTSSAVTVPEKPAIDEELQRRSAQREFEAILAAGREIKGPHQVIRTHSRYERFEDLLELWARGDLELFAQAADGVWYRAQSGDLKFRRLGDQETSPSNVTIVPVTDGRREKDFVATAKKKFSAQIPKQGTRFVFYLSTRLAKRFEAKQAGMFQILGFNPKDSSKQFETYARLVLTANGAAFLIDEISVNGRKQPYSDPEAIVLRGGATQAGG